ncbi:mitotic cohesin complex, putative [Babesia caballi]|uniref:Mitotic cohesin complex, putative n=1 Tax=Babesia caballi TaxID=5871 RepID=A0AAV4LWP8_BABCB|nr:mitotic cohesin complex, putative [Babesia caballi]
MAPSHREAKNRFEDVVPSSGSDDDTDDEDYSEAPIARRRHAPNQQERQVREDVSGVHVTSRLFEIVIMHKHVRLQTCLRRLLLTLNSEDRYIAIADILSFICECVGFRHSLISADLVEACDALPGVPGGKDLAQEEQGAASSESPFHRDMQGERHYADDTSRESFAGVNTAHVGSGDRREYRHALDLSPQYGTDSTAELRRSRRNSADSSSPRLPVSDDQASDLPLTYENFGWGSLREMFMSLPATATYSEIVRHCSAPSNQHVFDTDDSLFFPQISDLLANRRSQCLSTKFLRLCTDRVKRITTALDAEDGWTIGVGKRRIGFLRFKEFFQQLVLEADALCVGDLLHALQWVFALSLIGFREVRMFAVVACNDVVNSLLVKLESLAKNESVFRRQLQVEIEMDHASHENVHGRDSRVTLRVSKSSLELYKKLLLAQRAQRAILRFLKCMYNVNFASNLRDVLVDIRVASAFSLCTNVLLSPIVFSGPAYVDLVYRCLPSADETSCLLLLRYLGLVGRKLEEEELGILLALHETCTRDALFECCEVIEAMFLRDVQNNYDRGVVVKHRTEKPFLRLVDAMSTRKRPTLGVLIAAIYLPSLPIHHFTFAFHIRTDDLPPKHRNALVPHPAVVGMYKTLVVNEETGDKPDAFYQCFMELSQLAASISAKEAFVANLISSLWPYNYLYADVGGTVRFLCQGGDVESVKARLDENCQQLLLYITLASFEHLLRGANAFTDSQLDAVGTVLARAPVLLRLYRASAPHLKTALNLVEQATGFLSRTGLTLDKGLLPALQEAMLHLMEHGTSGEDERDAAWLGVRCLYNLYKSTDDAEKHVSILHRKACKRLLTPGELSRTTLYCALNLLHYFPLEQSVCGKMVGLIKGNLKASTGEERMLWCAIGYVLFEAELYNYVKASRSSQDAVAPELSELCNLRDVSLRSLAWMAHDAQSDFLKFVSLCSMVSLVQNSALLCDIQEPPDEVQEEMFNVLHHFLSLVRPSQMRAPAAGSSSPPSLDRQAKGITVADVCITGYSESNFLLNPLDSVLCVLERLTKAISGRQYFSGVSVLVLMQMMSACDPVVKAAGVYLRFLGHVDSQYLASMLLFAMIGLYESGARNLVCELSRRCLDHVMGPNDAVSVDCKRLSVDRMVLSGVRYALQGPSNWDFLTDLTEFVKFFKGYGGKLNGQLLQAQVGALMIPLDLSEELRGIVFLLLRTVGVQGAGALRAVAGCDDIDGVDSCLNAFRRKCGYVDFLRLAGGEAGRKRAQRPSSTCIVKRTRPGDPIPHLLSSETRASSEESTERGLDVSPIVARTFTKSNVRAFPPSVGMMKARPRVGAPLSPQSVDDSLEFEPLEFHSSADVGVTPSTERSYGVRSSPRFGRVSPGSSVLSPLMLPL